ncbi:MAG: DUF4412 domain-containing protein [Pyrinomonadaceae bacterium]|nr:DUF4412 domain-containing protein [Pyrinomonadaceae bacterium]
MKRTAILTLAAIIGMAANVMADVKIKTKQTMSGQTTENTTYIKGKRQRTEMMGGMMVSITQCDLARDLQINPSTKTYTISYYDDGKGNITPASGSTGASPAMMKGGTMYVTTTIKDTGERKQMFGFTARRVIQTIETESSPDACNPTKTKMEMDMWVIDAEFGLACTQNNPYRSYNGGKAGGCSDKIVPKTIGTARSGYPLYQKMTSFDANGRESFSMIQEVVEMSKATLDASLFEVPADYREVKDAAQMYASAGTSGVNYSGGSASSQTSSQSQSGLSSTLKNAAEPNKPAASAIGPKKAGTVRIGLAGVKTGAVGDGISAADLSAAVQNSLSEYLRGTMVELVPLEAKLPSAQADEAKAKECDFVIMATASHKKGGGGFGFGKMMSVVAPVVGQTGIGHTGSTAGNIAGQMATNAIVSAGTVAGRVKSKDEITLDLKVTSTVDNSSPLTRQFKAKAKSDGDDLISAIAEQAAQAILDAVK